MTLILGQAAPAPSTPQAFIKDVNLTTFASEVLRASQEVAVLVDFWAPWCGPCKQLTPLLEKIVATYKGQVILAKINIDENQPIAMQMGIQSVPTVILFKQGRPVDGFSGALPETQIKQFLNQHIGAAHAGLEDILQNAKVAFDNKEYSLAQNLYAQILGQDNTHYEAIAGFIKCLIHLNQIKEAEQMLGQIEKEQHNNPFILSAKASLELAKASQNVPQIASLEQNLANHPDELSYYLPLALAYFAQNDVDKACETLLRSIKKDRHYEEGKAKAELLKLFESIGLDHPLTLKYRRELSTILFS